MSLKLDSRLIESARAGGVGLDRLLEAIWPEAYRVALSVLRDVGLAEDAAQDACVALARSLPTLKVTGAFHSWSYKIIVSHAISVARRQPRTERLDTVLDRGGRFDHSDALDLDRALGQLPVVQRAVIIMHYYAGLNSSEIASATKLPASTVRFHLMRARKALRLALSVSDADLTQPTQEACPDVR